MNRNTKDVEEMTGFRKATDDEAKGIYQYMRNYFWKCINIYMISFGICLDYELLFLALHPSMVIFTVFAVLVLFFEIFLGILIVFRLLYEKKCVSIYKKRQYRVLEGHVSEVSTNASYNTDCVKFISRDGQCLDRWYDLDTTGCDIGDSLLLMAPNTDFLEPQIFTSDMLGK